MSHQPERKEKDCLNCGAEVQGRYCGVCGQENIVTKQNFWSLGKHFVYDIFHFDGKFFDTLKYLITKPGRVPREYVSGKRMSYLDPIRMYLFTSALFFLVFFTFNPGKVNTGKAWSGRLTSVERLAVAKDLRAKEAVGGLDSFERKAIDMLLDSTQRIYIEEADSTDTDSIIHFNGQSYRFTPKEKTPLALIDSSIKEKNWLKRLFKRKFAEIENRYDNGNDALRIMMDQFVHRIPYMLFLSLPFFALILKLLYVRRKEVHYHEHIIFTLYHYIFTFLLMLLLLGVAKLADWWESSLLGFVIFAIIIYGQVYLYKGMRNFYGQSLGKTILKFFLLNLLGFFLVNLLLFAFLLFTAIQFK